jgi:ribonuclease P protein component
LNNKSYKFSKHNLIRKKKHFEYIFNNSEKADNFLVRIYYAPAHEVKGKIAFIAGKRVGNAVKRNKGKRRLREIFRLNQYKINWSYDLIVVVKQKVIDENFDKINNAVLILLEKRKLLVV